MKKEQFDITGMTCSACSSRVEGCVVKLPGVKEVSVNLLKNSMVVSYDEAQLSTAGIVEAMENTGYGAFPKGAPQRKAEAKAEISTVQAEYKAMKQRLLLSAVFTLPLFYISMGHMMNWPMPGFLLGMENALVFAFTQFLLLLPVLIVNGRYFRVGLPACVMSSRKAWSPCDILWLNKEKELISMKVSLKNWLIPLLFTVGGALVGLAYYYFVGCAAGSCAITSNPINSMLYMGLMGWLLSGVFSGGCAGGCSL